MARKKAAKPAQAPLFPDAGGALAVQNAAATTTEMAPAFKNGLADILGFPQNQGTPWSAQLSQPTTLFKNLRWYLISNDRQLLNEMYVELGLVQTIIDVPVDDGLRGGVEIRSKQLDEDQIDELKVCLDRQADLTIAGQGEKWNRLFGGGGIIALTDQDPELPLDVAAINADSALDFKAVDMWELNYDLQTAEGFDPTGLSVINPSNQFYSYYGEKLHRSRVMQLKGLEAPSFVRPRLRGWGYSVAEKLVRSINQYLKATDLAFEVLDEFKVDIYKIKNLTNALMNPMAEQQIRRRVQLANMEKNFNNALTMDSEDDWDHKQLSFAGLGETMEQIRLQVAADMRMPFLKLFGQAAAGMNASDEESLEVYNSMVESEVRNKLKYPILRILELRCQQRFGFIPDDLAIEFPPLRVMTAEQQENVKTHKFTRLQQARSTGEISSKEFRDACNKGKLFDITLDEEPDVGDFESDEISDANAVDDNAPGANKVQDENPRTVNAIASKWSRSERAIRAVNSASFDKRSYEADGGDGWIDARRRELFDRNKAADQGLWDRACSAARDTLGDERFQFVTWWYLKMGGSFR